MKWIIEYVNGKSIGESDINFQLVDKKNIKLCYFIDENNNRYGLNFLTKSFFINNTLFDFKIKQEEFNLVQYKSASITWATEINEKINSWNVGLKNQLQSYVMSITPQKEVYLKANRTYSGKSESKTIRLQ